MTETRTADHPRTWFSMCDGEPDLHATWDAARARCIQHITDGGAGNGVCWGEVSEAALHRPEVEGTADTGGWGLFRLAGGPLDLADALASARGAVGTKKLELAELGYQLAQTERDLASLRERIARRAAAGSLSTRLRGWWWAVWLAVRGVR